MKKHLVLIGLLVPVAALFIWVAGIEVKYSGSPKVLIKAEGYDPRDLLSGHYLQLRLNWHDTDCKQFADNECPRNRFEYTYRFYLPEHDAELMDSLISSRRNLDMDLEFSMHAAAAPLLKELYVEKQPWKAWLQKEKTKQLAE